MQEAEENLEQAEDQDTLVELENVDQPSTEETVELADQTEKDTQLQEHSKGVEKRINKLTARLREAERREKAAIEIAEFTKQENENLKTQQTQAGDSFVSEFQQRIDLSKTMLEQQLKDAYDKGDTDLVAKTTKLIADTAVEEQRLNYIKQQKEVEVQQPEQPVQQQAPQQPMVADPKAEEWAEKHEWFGEDEPMTLSVLSFHQSLRKTRGDAYIGTDEYYEELDRKMQETFPHKFQKNQAAPESSPAVAAASNNRSNKANNKVTERLTPSEVAMAKKIGVPLAAYAEQKRLKAQQI